MNPSSIEWTDATWNPTRGCSRVSRGCEHCYAELIAARFSGSGAHFDEGAPFHGYAKPTLAGPRWTGRVEVIPDKLDEPLRWRKPRRVFVNSMSDLFHEKLTDEEIDRVFAVMARSYWHVFQVLTKRPERMLQWSTRTANGATRETHVHATSRLTERWPGWPLPNVWLGVSVEDQATADERIPLLLQTPTAIRFVSYEPALASVDFEQFLSVYDRRGEPSGPRCNPDGSSALGWLIVGGESGPGARPFDIAWARSAIAQCKAAGVACFVKQLGSAPICDLGDGHREEARIRPIRLSDRKGGDPAEWPSDLRVREFAAPQREAVPA